MKTNRKPSFIVSDSSAAKRLSVYVVLRPNGDHAAIIRFLHSEQSVKMEAQVWNADGEYELWNSTANGYGYDKKTSAMAGLTIDGIVLQDHCTPATGLDATSVGAYGANPDGNGGYTKYYFLPGLKRLEALGYRVIQAL